MRDYHWLTVSELFSKLESLSDRGGTAGSLRGAGRVFVGPELLFEPSVVGSVSPSAWGAVARIKADVEKTTCQCTCD